MHTRGALLDVDGTLLDSNDAHAHAWVEALFTHGISIPFSRVRPLIGMGGDRLLAALGIPSESEGGRSLRDRHTKVFLEKWLPRLRPFPKARELVEKMRDEGLARVVATSANAKELEGILDAAEIADLVEDATTASDVPSSKPAPDVVEAAAALAQLPASDLVMLGDTPYDVSAARKAGIPAVALRCGGWKDAQLAGALRIYDDPEDLLAHWASSPFAER